MDAATRHDRYNAMDRQVTPAQRRRMRHKSRSRKTHAHVPGERCLRCRPAPQHRPEQVPFRPYN